MDTTRLVSVYTPRITAAIKGMETVRLTIRELIFALMIVLNGPIQAHTYDDRMKIARRLECSDRTVRKVLFNLKRAGVLEMDDRKIYRINFETRYAVEMLKHVMDQGSEVGLCILINALELDHFAFTMAIEHMKNRTTADKPTYASRW